MAISDNDIKRGLAALQEPIRAYTSINTILKSTYEKGAKVSCKGEITRVSYLPPPLDQGCDSSYSCRISYTFEKKTPPL